MRRQYVTLLGLLAAVIFAGLLFVVSIATEPYIAVMGAYAPFALAIASIVFLKWNIGTFKGFSINPINTFKLTLVAYFFGIATLAHNDSPTAIGTVTTILSALVVAQWLSNDNPRYAIVSAVALFTVTPLAVYLNTGLFYGHGDPLIHLRNIEVLISTGEVSSMPLERYQQTPGLHYLISIRSLITGLQPYDMLIITGITLFATTIVVAGLIGRSIYGQKAIMPTIFGTIGIAPVTFYSLYFFPQSLALCMLIMLVLFAYKFPTPRPMGILIISGIFVLSTIFTHSLTIFLFSGVILTLFALNTVASLYFSIQRPNSIVLTLPVIGGVTYWTFWHERFLFAVNRVIATVGVPLLNSPLYSENGTSTTVTQETGLGVAYPTPGIEEAIAWFSTPASIYYTMFVAISVVSIMRLVSNNDRSNSGAGIVATGALGVMLLTKTPVVFTSKVRVALLFTPFVAMLLGNGILSIHSQYPGLLSSRTLGCVLIVGLIASAPLVGLFSVERTGYSTGDAYSEAEITQMPATAEFAKNHLNGIAGIGKDPVFFKRYGVAAKSVGVTNAGIKSSRPMLFRNTMSQYKLTYRGEKSLSQGAVIMTSNWQRSAEAENNKIYEVGSMSIIDSRKNETIRPIA